VDTLALLPGLIALLVLSRSGVESAFMNVYIPTAILLPWCVCVLPGVPDPSFSQSAMLPIAMVFFWRSRFRWRFSALDILVFAFAGWAIASEYLTNGFIEAQNISFNALTQGIIAYLLGKELIASRGQETRFARRFVFLIFVICALSVWEFRMQSDLFKLMMAPFFPKAGLIEYAQRRWNVGRIAGPFSHSIVAGVNIMAAILINRWLSRSGKWERYFRWCPLPFKKEKIITAGLIAGSLMTLSRGPWIGGVFGFALAQVGAARNPRKALALACAFVAVAGVATWVATAKYTSAGRAAPAEEQASAAYRTELLTEYRDIALERPVFGWGGNFPVIGGMTSIDNAYLLMMLIHGVPYAGMFVLFLVVMVIRLVSAGLKADPQERPVLFALAGVFVSFIVSLGTVWLPPDTQGILFLLAGWAEARVIGRSVEVRQQSVISSPARYQFERVYA
jgi:hypothetical protein